MLHDALCERDNHAVTIFSLGCQCASRAYRADPLPDDTAPIYAELKTPGQEGG